MLKGKFAERIKGIVIGIMLTSIIMTTGPAFARIAQETITVNFNNIRIAIDGRVMQTENEPFIYNGRTYLPVRDVADAMGFDVTWENATNTVHLTSRTNLNAVPNYPPHNPVTPVPPIGEIRPGQSSGGSQGSRPSNPAISLERAIQIAYADLADRNINANFRKDSGMDWERRQWVWELEFRPTNGRGVIEYYINVNTGAIVKFEWDR